MDARHALNAQKTSRKFSCSFKLHPQSRQIMFEPFHTKIKSSKIQQVLLLKDAKLMKN